VPRAPDPHAEGLPALRRSGEVTGLLFLYECATLEPTQLRPIADHLGLTVQAASHSFRQLSRAGLVEVREGHYRPTVRGVASLHAALDRLGADVAARLARLHVVRSTRAVATETLAVGETVSLELRDGVLSAHRGASGPSRGRVSRGAPAGGLVEVGQLEGIVPIVPAPVTIYSLAPGDIEDPALGARVRRALASAPGALVAAEGLEAYHALRSAVAPGALLRFAVAASCRAASKVGVPSTVVVVQDGLPHLLAEFSGPDPPPLEVRALPGHRSARARHR
jgi:putative transcriptional regulator